MNSRLNRAVQRALSRPVFVPAAPNDAGLAVGYLRVADPPLRGGPPTPPGQNRSLRTTFMELPLTDLSSIHTLVVACKGRKLNMVCIYHTAPPPPGVFAF